MSTCPETTGSKKDSGKEHSPKRGSSRKTVCVGVQSNRLCTLTVLVEELLLHERKKMEQW